MLNKEKAQWLLVEAKGINKVKEKEAV